MLAFLLLIMALPGIATWLPSAAARLTTPPRWRNSNARPPVADPSKPRARNEPEDRSAAGVGREARDATSRWTSTLSIRPKPSITVIIAVPP